MYSSCVCQHKSEGGVEGNSSLLFAMPQQIINHVNILEVKHDTIQLLCWTNCGWVFLFKNHGHLGGEA